ncbi:uncharacterized protein BYT42DRAFT_566533 [Radiomyces spectabilis]|uniref:uncharacterized protein n=1 Tax=Radiomyces spectabilis TaxID=64574 RepID=UPI002220331D|nr:uncharacterized protein BYT42DRAFT_566533 [Radiomyces spectabilis]KAI8381443.1 hypothetical protein BYT42DRAFT_566533 [Radiomyces spectabilis]
MESFLHGDKKLRHGCHRKFTSHTMSSPCLRTRNVIHLRITPSTSLRVIIYLRQENIAWFNENGLLPLVISTLQPVVVNHLVTTQAKSAAKRKKEMEIFHTLNHDSFSLAYRFTWHDIHQAIMLREPLEETSTLYRPLSIYPYQLSVSIDHPQFNHTILDAYFRNL